MALHLSTPGALPSVRARVPEPSGIDARRLDLWYVLPDYLRDETLLESYRGLLSAREERKWKRLRLERHRHTYLITRALVRSTLTHYHPVDPRAWTFRENRYGRPEIAGPAGAPPLRFSVSHTNGFIAFLVGVDRDLGVDVENLEWKGTICKTADRYYSPVEAADVRRQPPPAQRTRFLEYWTLKEAYTKARGMGLSLPLDAFSFRLDEGCPIPVSFAPDLSDDQASWQFELFRPTGCHVLSVATRRGEAADLPVVFRPCVPLAQ